ncbi:MAG: AAA domain-containing protein [Bacteroidales bacterium]
MEKGNFNLTKIKQWLQYYKNSLADADRKLVQVSGEPILVENYYIENVPVDFAFSLWNNSKDKENEDSLVAVDICPCSFQFEYEHAKGKGKQVQIVYPFWIPAKMSKDGQLFPNGKPFFVRDYLSPNPKSFYTISSIQKVDECLQRTEFSSNNWRKYWSDCESFLKLAIDKDFSEYNIENERKIYVQKGELRNLSANILNLYNSILTLPEKHVLLNKIMGFENIVEKPFPSTFNCFYNTLHIGQMSDTFPLSVSQRQSIRVFNQLGYGDVLAVNGPPGTGKTTLLQTILANSIVRGVFENKPPELIIASSTNNQAITNILESFNLTSTSDYSKRWIPELSSFGLYLSTKVNNKYQTCTSPFGDGFISDFESSDIISKTEYFLEEYAKYYEKEDDLNACIYNLRKEVKDRVRKIEDYLLITKRYEENEELLNTLGCKTVHELVGIINIADNQIKDEAVHQNFLKLAGEQLLSAKKNRSFFDKLFFFLPKVKTRRALSYQRAMIGVQIPTDADYSSYSELTFQIDKLFVASSQREFLAVEKKAKLTKSLANINLNEDNYNSIISDWDDKYPNKLLNLYRDTGNEYKNLSPLEDISVRMDISFRSEAFWLSIHCREAEYLVEWGKIMNSTQQQKERAKDSYKSKLHRIACITPIFISTFHSLPRFTTYYSKGEVMPYFELFDLMIVDEAGQVSPDVSVPSFSLAKKAIVVGDVLQIEPVWSVEENVDIVNLQTNNIIDSNHTDEDYELLLDSGRLCSSGNLMKLAQNACEYSIGGFKGALLREHRRCLDSIISYSNKYVYNNQLLPKKGNFHSKQHNLPSKGFFHINSDSEVEGKSRVNKTDARVIAKWIDEQCNELEKAYCKAIENIIAVVTPYKSQSYWIKKELTLINRKKYNKIITGTVHALQGAEMEIVIFSTVLSKGDITTFVDSKYNMLNVAVSRAKHSFLVFGDIRVLDSSKNTPLGNLKKWLLEEENSELSNKLVFDSTITHDKSVKRISKLSEHVEMLRHALDSAKNEVIIVSPFISIHAIEADQLVERAKIAINRGVRVLVYTDSKLDTRNGSLKDSSQKGRDVLKNTGVILKVVDGIHNKTLIVDDFLLVEGSFNWLSAVREESSPFYRNETSIVLSGEGFLEQISQVKRMYLS